MSSRVDELLGYTKYLKAAKIEDEKEAKEKAEALKQQSAEIASRLDGGTYATNTGTQQAIVEEEKAAQQKVQESQKSAQAAANLDNGSYAKNTGTQAAIIQKAKDDKKSAQVASNLDNSLMTKATREKTQAGLSEALDSIYARMEGYKNNGQTEELARAERQYKLLGDSLQQSKITAALAESAEWENERFNEIMSTNDRTLMLNLERLVDLSNAKIEEASERGDERRNGLSETEKRYNEIYSYLTSKYGDQVDGWIEYAKRMDNRSKMYASEEKARKAAEENPFWSSVGSIPLNTFSGAGYLDVVGQKLQRSATGSSAPIDYNSHAQTASKMTNTIRGTVSKDMGTVGSLLYNTAMSMGDTLLAMPMGNAGMAILGASAATNAMQEAVQRGATDNQALAIGLVAGGLESVMEKLSIDSLLSLKDADTVKTVVYNALKQGASEGAEEGLTTLANTVADVLIMGDKNALATQKRDLIASGMSAAEAEKIANREWAKNLALDTIGGMISGGAFGSVKSGIYYAANRNGNVAEVQSAPQVEQQVQQVQNASQANVDAIMPNIQQQQQAQEAAQPTQTVQPVQQAAPVEQAVQPAQATAEQRVADAMAQIAEQSKNAPVNDQRVNNNQITLEAPNYGEEGLHLRDSGQRAGGQNPGGQIPAVETGAGRNQIGNAESTAADLAAASLSYGGKVSTASLGIPGGTSDANIRIVTGGETAATRAAMNVAQENGLKLTLFVGDNLQIANDFGGTDSVRGYISGDRVYVRADHPLYTADQLMRHEVGHAKIHSGEINPKTVRRRIAREYSRKHVSYLSKMYAAAYEGSGMTANEIWEEVICDSLGDMNIFQKYRIKDATGVLLNEAKVSAEAETQTTRGPPATVQGKTSIETFADGQQYVRADRQVLTGSDPEAWSEQLEDYINGKIRRGQDVRLIAADGDVLVLTKRTAGKVASMFANGRPISEDEFTRKINAGAHIDELAAISTRGKKTVADYGGKHGKDASGGWNYRTAFFQDFDGKYYRCRISVEIGEDGSVVYNIGEMKERSFPEIKGSSANSGARVGETSFEKSIDSAGEKVKGKFSKETPMERDATAAPVFYSQMERVVQDMKQPKFGASSVVSMLRGRGVKAEEIKWSGIEQWLDGKKSVTKNELQEFIRNSQLEIKEQELGGPIKYTPEQEAEIRDIKTELDGFWDQLFDVWPKIFGKELPADVVDANEVYDAVMRKTRANEDVIRNPETRTALNLARRIDSLNVSLEIVADRAKMESGETAKWDDYKLDGGANYREYLFKLPGSEYSNPSMMQHWGDNRGVLAHARVQDFDTANGKMLFIEEIQSDWHNEGAKRGYVSLANLKSEYEVENIGDRMWAVYHAELGLPIKEVYALTEESVWEELLSDARYSGKAPDAPFSKNYHEFVLKNLIRKAAEEGYDSIGWTTADMQSERWSDEYAEGYRIEYDQDIPKFLNKYGKKWGAQVGKVDIQTTEDVENDTATIVWSMPITDAMKQSVLHEGQPLYSRELDSTEHLERWIDENGDSLIDDVMPQISDTKETNKQSEVDSAMPNIRGQGQNAQPAMGAADSGFDPYSHASLEYGAIEPGENPARVVDVPKSVDGETNVMQTVRTIMEADATPDAAIPGLEEAIVKGKFSQMPIADQAAAERAESTIRQVGYQTALADWRAEIRSGKVSKDSVVLGETLYNAAVNAKDYKSAVKIAVELSLQVRSAAQALQAIRMLKKMSPTAQLYGVKQSVDNLQKTLTDKYGKRAPNLKINEEFAAKFLEAETKEAREAAEKALYKDIAKQIPATFADKWNAWRYLSMLGNPRTHIRNILGNAMFAPVRAVKNTVGAGIEAGAQLVGIIDRSQRTKAIVPAGRDLMKAARDDYKNVEKQVLSAGKYNSASDIIDENRRIFDNVVLETLRKGNSKLLDLEDSFFSKGAYASSLASYLKAQGFTAADFTGDGMTAQQKDAARAYAIKEAQKATYRDINDFSEAISSIGFKNPGDSKAKHAVNAVVEGIMPFKKTPANILVRGMEYSPAGLAKALTTDIRAVAKGKITAAEYMDRLASGLTGSGLFVLGCFLSNAGILVGGSPEDEDQANLEGRQPYSLEIGNTSITLDWLAPEAMPVFMGVELMEAIREGGGDAPLLDKVLSFAKGLSGPMMEMSMMSSLQDALDATAYADNKALAFISNSALGYLKQAIPTVFGQLERSLESSVRQTTFTQQGDKYLTKDAQYTLGSVANKVPFYDYNQIPYIDAWGRTEDQGNTATRLFNNMLNPAYVSTIQETPVDAEIKRLEKVLGAGHNLTPSRAQSVLTIDGKKIILTANEYVTYAQAKGQNDLTFRQNLIDSDAYKALDDEAKFKAMEYSRDLANALAIKETGFDDPNMADWMTELIGADADTITRVLTEKAVNSRAGMLGENKYLGLETLLENKSIDDQMALACMSNSCYEAYTANCENAGISVQQFLDAYGTASAGGETSAEKKQAALDYIATMDISAEQKGALAQAVHEAIGTYAPVATQIPDQYLLDIGDIGRIEKQMGEDQREKYDTYIKDSDVEMQTYLDMLEFYGSDEAKTQYDANGKAIDGEETKDHMEEYIRSLDISDADKGRLYCGLYSEKNCPKDLLVAAFGTEAAEAYISEARKEGYEKYVKGTSIDILTYFDLVDYYNSSESDGKKDANGKTIKGESKQDHVIAWIDALDLSNKDKGRLFCSLYAVKNCPYKWR